jgi:hypothetical protein
MSILYLCLYHDLSCSKVKYRVRLDDKDPIHTETSDGSVLCSLSPIFPSSTPSFVPRLKSTYQIVFLVHRDPFVQIGKLGEVERGFLWYSLGISSLIGIFPDKATALQVCGKLDDQDVYCREVWTVANERLRTPKVHITPLAVVQLQRKTPAALPKSPHLLRIIREMHLNFASLIKRSRILMPSLVPTVERMVGAVENEIKVMLDHETVREQTVSSMSQNPELSGVEAQKYLNSHKQVNLSIDALIQLNSALAYILSQSFYGAPPLANNLALHSCYSLLGVGTAIKAIQRLIEFVSDGFSELPVALIIKYKYSDTTLETFFDDDGDDKLPIRTVDNFSNGLARTQQSPKLAYFSTRMGFSEHGYCVTAASQCLAASDSARRTLLTLTHELLHSHVKGLFATMLTTNLSPGEEPLLSLVREYKRGAAEYHSNSACQNKWKILPFLRYRIFLFCDGMHSVVSRYPSCKVSDSSASTDKPGPDIDDHAEMGRFTNSIAFLNELVVHVLDLHYFYDEAEHLYLSTLWKSWATVPGVADKIEWYILRSLTAVSVINMRGLCKEDFDTLEGPLKPDGRELDARFLAAISSLAVVLEELSAQQHSAPILGVVLTTLQDPSTRRWLRAAFFPCHLFAQVVKQFLYSPRLRHHFDSFEDPLTDRTDTDPVYRLETLEFPRSPVRNPIALMRDRLRREIDNPDPLNEDARSAWLFLALASLPNHPTEVTSS